MDPTLISAAILSLGGIASGLVAWFTASDKKRRARLKKLEVQNVDAFGYIYDLEQTVVTLNGRDALPTRPASLKPRSNDDDE